MKLREKLLTKMFKGQGVLYTIILYAKLFKTEVVTEKTVFQFF